MDNKLVWRNLCGFLGDFASGIGEDDIDQTQQMLLVPIGMALHGPIHEQVHHRFCLTLIDIKPYLEFLKGPSHVRKVFGVVWK